MQLTFAVQPEGLTLTVLVGLSHETSASLAAAGLPIPPPLWRTALIDTGTDVTCVSAAVLRSLGASSLGEGTTQTASATMTARLFEVSLSVPLLGPPPGTHLLHGQLTVMELPQAIPKIDVLIGLDMLLMGRLLLDGPARQFTLDY